MTLLAFNWAGYRLISGFLEHNADITLDTKIDHSDYDESTLIELRVPLNAPYLAGNPTEYERYEGELEIGGTHYRYVKRKIVDGELVLLCVPNENKNTFQNSRIEFFKLVNDLNQSTQKSKSSSSFKSFVTEYKQEDNSWNIAALSEPRICITSENVSFLTAVFSNIPEQPPKG